MRAKIQKEREDQIKIYNNQRKITKAKKHFQKLKYKPLLTSTETEKSNIQHKHLFTSTLASTVKRINTQESNYSNVNSTATPNLENSLIKKTTSSKVIPLFKNGLNNKTPIMLSKNIENKKKRKQVSIDLQNRYYNIVHKNYMDNSKNEKEKNMNNSNSNIKKNIMMKSSDSKKSSIIIKDKDKEFDKIKSIKINKFILKDRDNEKEKEKENEKNNSRRKSLYESNKKPQKKINENEIKEDSQILDSIYTFKTLFNINDNSQKKIYSPEQIEELKELKLKLNFIKNIRNQSSNILQTATTSSTKFNIISADMLDSVNDNDNNSIFCQKNEKDNKCNIEEINNEIILSSNQRLQTYKILLDCINNKFKEIEELVEKEDSIINNNYIKMSELHSKIEFSQDDFSKDSQTTIINLDDRNESICDIIEEEMKEKSNIIIPTGNINYNYNDNINKDFELLTKSMMNKVDYIEQNSINSELLLKNLNDYDNTELVSFISNGMISLIQSNNSNIIQNNQNIIDIKKQKNSNLDNNKCQIF